MRILRGLPPVLVLFFLSPLVAEYLLGNVSVRMLVSLPFLALLYGSGAVLIRELTRRTGRGWPTVVALALAYAVIEEGIATQSFFNPHYVGQELLAYGFVPALGMAGPWTVYMLGLHAAWSIAVPILLTETFFRGRGESPWLGKVGLAVVAVLFVLGVAVTAFFSIQISSPPFVASAPQLIGSLLAAAVLAVLGFVLFRPAGRAVREPSTRRAPSPWVVAVTAFAAGSVFHGLMHFGQEVLPAAVEVMLAVLAGAAFVALVAWWSGMAGWSAVHRFGAAAGGLAVYWWLGPVLIHGKGAVDLVGWAVIAVLSVALLVFAGLRLRGGDQQSPGEAGTGTGSAASAGIA